MGGVDLSDQLLHYFSFLRKSTKWSRKLLIHIHILLGTQLKSSGKQFKSPDLFLDMDKL